jgi:hypothetical protein
MTIILHPATVAKAGAGDLARHWQLRGYDVVAGGRYWYVREKQVEPTLEEWAQKLAWWK